MLTTTIKSQMIWYSAIMGDFEWFWVKFQAKQAFMKRIEKINCHSNTGQAFVNVASTSSALISIAVIE